MHHRLRSLWYSLYYVIVSSCLDMRWLSRDAVAALELTWDTLYQKGLVSDVQIVRLQLLIYYCERWWRTIIHRPVLIYNEWLKHAPPTEFNVSATVAMWHIEEVMMKNIIHRPVLIYNGRRKRAPPTEPTSLCVLSWLYWPP